eukprot:5982647-Amphidinium_carterae.1
MRPNGSKLERSLKSLRQPNVAKSNRKQCFPFFPDIKNAIKIKNNNYKTYSGQTLKTLKFGVLFLFVSLRCRSPASLQGQCNWNMLCQLWLYCNKGWSSSMLSVVIVCPAKAAKLGAFSQRCTMLEF